MLMSRLGVAEYVDRTGGGIASSFSFLGVPFEAERRVGVAVDVCRGVPTLHFVASLPF